MTTLCSTRHALLLVAVFSLISSSVPAGDKVVLTADDGKTAQIVASMVQSRHINHPEINDAVSEKLMNRYIEIWDPQKLYFLKSDIDSFAVEKDALDDKIINGNVEFATTVFERFRLRMDDRAAKIGAMIDAEQDFTADEDLIKDPDDVDWAVDETELNDKLFNIIFILFLNPISFLLVLKYMVYLLHEPSAK